MAVPPGPPAAAPPEDAAGVLGPTPEPSPEPLPEPPPEPPDPPPQAATEAEAAPTPSVAASRMNVTRDIFPKGISFSPADTRIYAAGTLPVLSRRGRLGDKAVVEDRGQDTANDGG